MNSANITTNDLLSVLDVTRRLAEQRMVQPLMEYVAATVFELIPAERCLIILFKDDGTPQIQIARDRQGNQLRDAQRQISSSILQRVTASMTPLLINDVPSEDTFNSAQSMRRLNMRSVLCVPLISFGQAIGALYVENRSGRENFQDSNIMPLVLFAHQVAVALENAHVYEALEARIVERTHALQEANVRLARQAAELREQSFRDNLTGLHNRRYFNELLPQMFEMTRRYNKPLSLAFVDIDNFKHINDMIFYAGGDKVLATVAHIMHDNVRQADIVFRLSGEEFAIAMPETPLSTAHQACERLRQTLEEHSWTALTNSLHVTVSMGIADDNDCMNAQELMLRAETRLFEAKRLGKNRVVAEDVS